ncbi:MAG: PH domain-containing protein [Oscillospiraceae bacterium]|nr:PH domain-containing protein [Oscillospiraceae bacterium]MDD4413575.1 PH domain-containing protein [Oscillospiraceae bacterium]
MHFSADKSTIKVMTVWISVFGIVLSSLISALAGLLTPWLLIISAAVGAATVFVALRYPPKYASVMKVDFDGIAVKAVTGVFIKKQLFVPMTALRTFELCSTPVQRFFGCRTVILRFAGGAVFLPLLPVKQAEELVAALEEFEESI